MQKFVQTKRTPIYNNNGKIAVACPPMKSNVNISMISRSASFFGISELIVTGQNRITKHISRECTIPTSYHNSLMPIILKYKDMGYRIIGLEQSVNSQNLFNYRFPETPVLLVAGNECTGMDQKILDVLDDVLEIPLLGNPHSLNVAVAVSVCLYEYAKQFNG